MSPTPFFSQSPREFSGEPLVSLDPGPPEILGRAGSMDLHIYHHMFEVDEYRLKNRSFHEEDRILDIGGHAGYFTLLMLRRGLKHIHVYEMQPDNLQLCRYHLQKAPETVRLFDEAVWDEDGKELLLSDHVPVYEGIDNTGGYSLLEQGSLPVTTVSFDQAVERLTEGFTHRIRFLKLYAEGAEWPILIGATTLSHIDEIVGEFHEYGGNYDQEVPEGFPYGKTHALTRQLLRRILVKEGFSVRYGRGKSRYGIFFATRARTPMARWRRFLSRAVPPTSTDVKR